MIDHRSNSAKVLAIMNRWDIAAEIASLYDECLHNNDDPLELRNSVFEKMNWGYLEHAKEQKCVYDRFGSEKNRVGLPLLKSDTFMKLIFDNYLSPRTGAHNIDITRISYEICEYDGCDTDCWMTYPSDQDEIADVMESLANCLNQVNDEIIKRNIYVQDVFEDLYGVVVKANEASRNNYEDLEAKFDITVPFTHRHEVHG